MTSLAAELMNKGVPGLGSCVLINLLLLKLLLVKFSVTKSTNCNSGQRQTCNTANLTSFLGITVHRLQTSFLEIFLLFF